MATPSLFGMTKFALNPALLTGQPTDWLRHQFQAQQPVPAPTNPYAFGEPGEVGPRTPSVVGSQPSPVVPRPPAGKPFAPTGPSSATDLKLGPPPFKPAPPPTQPDPFDTSGFVPLDPANGQQPLPPGYKPPAAPAAPRGNNPGYKPQVFKPGQPAPPFEPGYVGERSPRDMPPEQGLVATPDVDDALNAALMYFTGKGLQRYAPPGIKVPPRIGPVAPAAGALPAATTAASATPTVAGVPGLAWAGPFAKTVTGLGGPYNLVAGLVNKARGALTGNAALSARGTSQLYTAPFYGGGTALTHAMAYNLSPPAERAGRSQTNRYFVDETGKPTGGAVRGMVGGTVGALGSPFTDSRLPNPLQYVRDNMDAFNQATYRGAQNLPGVWHSLMNFASDAKNEAASGYVTPPSEQRDALEASYRSGGALPPDQLDAYRARVRGLDATTPGGVAAARQELEYEKFLDRMLADRQKTDPSFTREQLTAELAKYPEYGVADPLQAAYKAEASSPTRAQYPFYTDRDRATAEKQFGFHPDVPPDMRESLQKPLYDRLDKQIGAINKHRLASAGYIAGSAPWEGAVDKDTGKKVFPVYNAQMDAITQGKGAPLQGPSLTPEQAREAAGVIGSPFLGGSLGPGGPITSAAAVADEPRQQAVGDVNRAVGQEFGLQLLGGTPALPGTTIGEAPKPVLPPAGEAKQVVDKLQGLAQEPGGFTRIAQEMMQRTEPPSPSLAGYWEKLGPESRILLVAGLSLGALWAFKGMFGDEEEGDGSFLSRVLAVLGPVGLGAAAWGAGGGNFGGFMDNSGGFQMPKLDTYKHLGNAVTNNLGAGSVF